MHTEESSAIRTGIRQYRNYKTDTFNHKLMSSRVGERKKWRL